jgi:hypothetical protein
MNKSIQFVGGLLLSVGLLVACGDDTEDAGGGPNGGGGGTGAGDTGGGGSGAGDTGGGGSDGGGGAGPRPEKGAAIDRMGRPAINTALNGAFIQFDANGDPQPSDNTQRLEEQDAYNEDTQPGDWAASYTEIFAANLAILDVLDAGAGNPQPGACENPVTSCANSESDTGTCYDFVAGALANDRLFVYADGAECSAAPIENEGANGNVGGYLSAEAAALVAGLTLTGCAGRRPIDDVIETTYSVVGVGALAGFDDGIGPDDVPEGSHPEVFPYIGEPL